MICCAVLDMLQDNQDEFNTRDLQEVRNIYQKRLDRRKSRIDDIAQQFPEFICAMKPVYLPRSD